MAQDILITPGIVEPQILFRGSGATTTAIELNVLAGYQSASGVGTALVFEGTEGQLFSITDNLSSGTIFNVGDITGLSLLSVDANGEVKLGEFGTGVIVYPGLTLEDYVPSTTTNVLYNNAGVLTWSGNLTASSFVKSGGTSSQFLKADGSVDSSTYLTGNQTITLTGDASGSGTTSIAVTVLNDSHTHDSRYYTETEIANYFSGTTAITGYNKTNWDTAYGWGNHASAGYLTGNQTITLTGDASGSGTTSISVTVANDSHTHDTRYYTETEIGQFFAGTTAITGYSKSNWDTAYGWGNHASAGYLTGNQTITLSGDVSGSGTTSISVVVADDSHNHIISNVDGLQSALDAKLATSLKGAANGLAELDANGTVPAAQLPSYVDDVLEYASTSNFPATGETGKIYVAQDTNKTYRWSGSSYVEISASLALGTTSSTAHRGDHGSTAYTHSQTTTGSVHGSSTVGGNFLRLSNPSAVTFIRVNADNSVSTLDAATFRTAIGAGTSSTTGTVTSVASGNGMNFTTITGSGTVTMGTPSSVTLASANSASGTTHTHAFAPGGTTAQYIRGDGTLATLPTYTVNNGTLTMGVSGTGLTGSATFTANQSGNSTFTVTSNATSANTASAIVARDGSGNFSAGTVNTTQLNADNLRLDGNTLSSTNTNGNVIITPNGLGGVAAGTSSTVSGHHAVVGGGCANTSSCCFTTVSGGYTNTASNYGSTVSGGYFNNASGSHSFIGGGFTNTASGCYATASGGYISCATGNYSTVSGGCRNTASGNYSAILGGKSNDTNSCCNTFILGSNITASQVDTTFTQKLFVSHTTGATETLFNVEGSNGSLFSVSDSLSGSLMSVNNNAGLPIFEVFDDDSIIGGRFAQDDFVLTTGGDLGLGTASPSTKLQVVGDVTASSFIKSGGTSSQFLKADGSVDSSTYLTGNQTITLSGDASGSGTTSINVTVANDSHTHDTRYYTETEIGQFFAGTTAITGYNKSNWDTAYGWGNHASAGYLTGNQTITLSGDVSGSGTTSISVTVADDSHNHVISNVDGLQTALDGKAATNQNMYIGTTQVAINRSSGALSLTGVSIDGNAGTVTNGVYTTGSYADPSWITSINYSKLTGTVPTWNQNTTGSSYSVSRTVNAGSDANLIYTQIAGNDFFRLRVGGATDGGYVELATADNSNEPIYVRQYAGSFATLTRTLTLLDASGNTYAPGTLTASSLIKSGGTSSQFLKADGSVDSNSYITGNQTITLTGDASGSGTTSIAVTVANDSHTHDTRYYTETEIANFFAGTTAITGYSKANWDTAYGWGNHASAGYLTGNQTITLSGDVSGSGTTSISVTVADDSHNHVISNVDGLQTALDAKANLSGATFTGDVYVGTGTADTQLHLRKADNNVADHLIFYNGTTRVGEIGVHDNDWLRINQVTAKNIYTPRYIRADEGFWVDGTTKGINGAGNFVGGTIGGASDANVTNWNTAYGWGNHASAGYLTGNQTITLSGDVSGSGTTSISVTVADDSHNHIISNVDGLQTALDGKLATSLKGAANGLAELDASGLVPSSQLPSYVDDVLEYASTASFPATGTAGKIYVAQDTNKTYRWSGSSYTEISASLALGSTSSTAHRGDHGSTAYTHSQTTTGSVHGSTTVGGNFFRLSNPSAVTFPRINADNTVSTLDAATFRSAIGAGTSSTTGTVTSVAAGNGLNFTTITGSGSVTLGTPGSTTLSSTNAVTTTSHTHAFAPGGTTAQYIRGDGTLATLPTYTVNNGTLTMAVSGTGLTGSASFTANQSGNSTFTVTSNATSANTASTIVARDASGNFSAGTVNTTQLNADNLRLDGNTLSSTNTNGNVIITPNGTGGIAAGASATVTGGYSTVGGGCGNTASGNYSTVGGGQSNCAIGNCSTVNGGYGNTASGYYSVVGGRNNTASGYGSTVSGTWNTGSSFNSTVSGGYGNTASGLSSTVSGGYENCSSGDYSAVSGGFCNIVSGNYSTIVGGQSNNDCGFANTFILGSSINATQANTTYTQKLLVSETTASGDTIFNVEGSGGSLFSVVDDLSGALMSVNTVAGLPALEVNSDYSLTAGRFNQNDFEITSGGDVGIGTASPSTKLQVAGSATATSFIKSGGTSSQFLKADGSVDSTSYTTCAGTVTSVAAGNGLNFTTITGSGSVTLGTPGSTTLSSTNSVSATSHTHAFAPGGTTAQYIRGDGTLATLPTYTVNNGTLTMAVSGTGLSGSASFTANQSGNSTFTVTSNATSANTASTIVARDASGNFSAGTVNTTQLNADNLRLDGNTLSSTNTNGNIILTPNGSGGIAAGTSATVSGAYATVGGGYANCASCNYSTVSGGYANCASYYSSTVTGGYTNTASGSVSTVGGGSYNVASQFSSTVSGGRCNTASGNYSTVSGGGGNCASGGSSTVSGGYGNTALSSNSTVSGGSNNCASACMSTVSGGWRNCALGNNSSVSGGCCNITNARHSTINGGSRNVIQSPTNECCSRGATIGGGVGHNSSGGTLNSTTGDLTGTITCCDAGAFSTISGGLRNCAVGACSTVGGGRNNTASGIQSIVSGGRSNSASGIQSTVSGGYGNTASGYNSTIGGGYMNCASSQTSTIGGGCRGTASGYYSTISGGSDNCASGTNSTVSGGGSNCASGACSTVGGGDSNCASGCGSTIGGGGGFICYSPYCLFYQEAAGSYSTIGGGRANKASGNCSTVSGGYYNCASGTNSSVSGGYCNITNARHSTINGGHRNVIQSPTNECCSRGVTIGGGVGHNSSGGTLDATTGDLTGTITCCDAGAFSTISGGLRNCAVGACSTVSGGYKNTASGTCSVVSGGKTNCVSGGGSVIGGGQNNTASGFYSTVSGGLYNCASGYNSTVGGGLCNYASGSYSTVGGGGSPFGASCASGSGSTIGGGRLHSACGNFSTISGGQTNCASGDESTVSGGRSNTASSFFSTIGGGAYNCASGCSSIVSGGYTNCASGTNSSVSGGCCNITNARHSTINGGHRNVIQSPTNECCSRGATIGGGIGHNSSGGTLDATTGDLTGAITCCDAGAFSTISGGLRNCATGVYSTVSGGSNNTASGYCTTIGGGSNNTASGYCTTIGGGISNTASLFVSTVSGGCSNTASSFYSTVGGGRANCASGTSSTIGGGGSNSASGSFSTIGGGSFNTASGIYSNVGGGCLNCVLGYASTVSGGTSNTSSAAYATVGGGESNNASGNYSTVSGGRCNTTSGFNSSVSGGCCNITNARHSTINGGHRNIIQSPTNECCSRGVTIGGGVGHNSSGGTLNSTTGDLTGTITCCNAGAFSTISGGLRNCATGASSTVSGGCGNTASSYYSTVSGGYCNRALGGYSNVSGGYCNCVSGNYSTVGGGQANCVSGTYSTVSGGLYNSVSGNSSTVGGGFYNSASGYYSTVSGGIGNTASGYYSTVSGGINNTASGGYSTISGGFYAKASKYGELSHAAGRFAQTGDAQHSTLVARRNTTDATANQALFLNGASERLVIPAETTWMFEIKLAAHNDTNNDGAWWTFRGGIKRDAANGTSIIGSVIEENSKDTNMSTASASVVADDTNEALEIRVTGVAAKNIRWVAVVDISQVSWGTP